MKLIYNMEDLTIIKKIKNQKLINKIIKIKIKPKSKKSPTLITMIFMMMMVLMRT